MRTAALAGALVLALGVVAGCGEGEDSEAGTPTETATTAASTRTTPAAAEPKSTPARPPRPRVDPQLKQLRADFKLNYHTYGEVSWYRYVNKIETIAGGWIYVDTKLHSDNPDTKELAKSICSGTLGVSVGKIDGLRGVSIYGVGSRKVHECQPFKPQ